MFTKPLFSGLGRHFSLKAAGWAGLAAAWVACAPMAVASPLADLGKQIFHDRNLSDPAGMACATCHNLQAGGGATGNPLARQGIVPDITGRFFGPRKVPSAKYAAFSPERYFDNETEQWIGGQFWDQRAASLEEQAKGPFLNPVEMANPNKAAVVAKLAVADYAPQMRQLFGANVFGDADSAFEHMAEAIATYERTWEFSPFNSRFDYANLGRVRLTAAELRGRDIFDNKGHCADCHPSIAGSDGTPALFTDFTSDNLGMFRNPSSPHLSMPAGVNPEGKDYIDQGVGGAMDDHDFLGRFKVPSLRNVGVGAPYFHNGAVTKLRDAVRFYNTGCTPGTPDHWPNPEIAANRNCTELGELGLTESEIDDLTAFLLTLTDTTAWGATPLGAAPQASTGDSLRVQMADGTFATFRLANVLAPRLGQSWGDEARQCLDEILAGKNWRVQAIGEDNLGRKVAAFYTGDENDPTDLSRLLAEAGCAWPYASPDPGVATLAEAARSQGKGLWAETNPQEPWAYRPEEMEAPWWQRLFLWAEYRLPWAFRGPLTVRKQAEGEIWTWAGSGAALGVIPAQNQVWLSGAYFGLESSWQQVGDIDSLLAEAKQDGF